MKLTIAILILLTQGALAATGANFKAVDLGVVGFRQAVKAPNGTIWSDFGGVLRGWHIDEEAAKYCSEIGGRVPTLEDYSALRQYFPHNQSGGSGGINGGFILTEGGRDEIETVFPGLKKALRFCSSSKHDREEMGIKETVPIFFDVWGELNPGYALSDCGVICVKVGH